MVTQIAIGLHHVLLVVGHSQLRFGIVANVGAEVVVANEQCNQLPVVRHVHVRIPLHTLHQHLGHVGNIAGHGRQFSDIEARRAIGGESIAQRVAVQIGIELLENVGQCQVLPPIVLPTNGPGGAAILDSHVEQIGCKDAVACGQRITQGTNDVNVAGTQPMYACRTLRAAPSWSIFSITELQQRARARRDLGFLEEMRNNTR